jgi:PAS domain S-box-containing protein
VHDITERKRVDALIARLNLLKENLLGPGSLDVKLKLITDEVVESFGADFARIWTIGEGDLCEEGCLHAMATKVQHLCRDRTRCLHLAVSSGRYTNIDGGHRRVPLGCYKVGRVGSGEEPSFITNEVTIDPRVHDREWARALGLVSFAGYRLLSKEGEPIGVLALFSKRAIAASEEILLEDLANTVSQVIQRGVAEEALRESEVRFRTVADFNYDWETWRGPDGTYVYVSPSCERVSGYRPEEFMADPELFVRIVHPDDREAVISHFKEELTSQHTLHLEFRIIDREGSEHWIGHTCQPVHKEDRTPLGPRASNRDITGRKEAEAELDKHRENLEELIKERTAELEKLNARLRVEISERVMAEKELLRLNEELDAYARTVSHELRTPLAGIWLALEYLERISGELSTESFEEEARDTVLKAKSTVKKADEQVKRLLELAEAGQVPTNVSDVDVSEIVGEVLFDIEEERSRSGARVEVNGDLGLIRANPTHIHQLFSNLIVNAVRHCDSREPQIEIALLGQESGTGRRYLVRDNGSGIPPELIDRLFSPFVKREGGGTGTGLAIVEKIVKIYNGSIRPYNDDGACFEFVLYDYQRSRVPNIHI